MKRRRGVREDRSRKRKKLKNDEYSLNLEGLFQLENTISALHEFIHWYIRACCLSIFFILCLYMHYC